MVDNITVTPGATGVPVAADDVGGILWQRVKLGFGADGSATDVQTTSGLPIQSTDIGNVADAVYSGSGNMSLIAGIKKLIAQFNAGFTMSGSVAMADAEGIKGQFGGITSNPSQTFTRLANTTAYTAGKLVANNATAGSVAYGAIAVSRVAAGGFQIDRCRLVTNHTTGLAGINFRTRLWTAQPVYAVGDGGTYGIATGGSGYLGSYTGACEQFGDYAVAIMAPDVASACVRLASGQTIYWDLMCVDAFTPQSGKTFQLICETKQD